MCRAMMESEPALHPPTEQGLICYILSKEYPLQCLQFQQLSGGERNQTCNSRDSSTADSCVCLGLGSNLVNAPKQSAVVVEHSCKHGWEKSVQLSPVVAPTRLTLMGQWSERD